MSQLLGLIWLNCLIVTMQYDCFHFKSFFSKLAEQTVACLDTFVICGVFLHMINVVILTG